MIVAHPIGWTEPGFRMGRTGCGKDGRAAIVGPAMSGYERLSANED